MNIYLLVSVSRFNALILSKGVNEYIRVKNEDCGISFLIDNKDAWKGAVILPTSDMAEKSLDAHFNELIEYYVFPNACQQGVVGTFMNKQLQVVLASESGLHVPISFRHRRDEKLPNDIIYPCVVKPQNSTTGQKGTLHICYNDTEILHAEETLHANDFLVQQYIDKEYELLLIGCRFPDGRIWLPGVFRKERWFNRGDDATYGLITTKVENLFSRQAEVCTFLERLDYYGPFSIEFGVKSGISYFYEINLRNDGTSHYFYKAGIYIPYIYYLANMNMLKDADLVVPEVCYIFMDEFGDIMNMLKARISFRCWWYDLRHASVYKYFKAGDILPFLAITPRRIIATIYRFLKSD